MHGVHGHRHIVAGRMPVAVRACRLRGIGLCLYPRLLAVFLDHRAPAFASHLQGDTVGVCAVGRMAVEATTGYNALRQEGILIEGVDISLIDADVASHLIAGLDTTIGQPPVVEAVFAHKDSEVLILRPLTVFLYTDRHREFASLILFGQLVPVVHVKVGVIAIGMQFSSLTAFDDHIHAVDGLISEVKVQWCDIGRNRHTDIIRIDLRQPIHLRRMLWLQRTRKEDRGR